MQKPKLLKINVTERQEHIILYYILLIFSFNLFVMGKAMSIQKNVTSIQSLKYKKARVFPSVYTKMNPGVQNEPSTECTEVSNRFDFALNDRLKQVYVTSENTNSNEIPPSRTNLPTNKSSRSKEEPHSQCTESVDPEILTLNRLNTLLSANQKNPDEWTPSKISEHYKINVDNAEKLLRYFGYFEVYVPNAKDIKAFETVGGGKIIKAEPIRNQLTANTDFNEMQKIMGSKKKSSS